MNRSSAKHSTAQRATACQEVQILAAGSGILGAGSAAPPGERACDERRLGCAGAPFVLHADASDRRETQFLDHEGAAPPKALSDNKRQCGRAGVLSECAAAVHQILRHQG